LECLPHPEVNPTPIASKTSANLFIALIRLSFQTGKHFSTGAGSVTAAACEEKSTGW
jgi:hypothetical protein